MRKVKCTCGTCKVCKNRLRRQQKKAGTWQPRIAKNQAADNAAAAKRTARTQAKEEAERARELKEAQKAANRARRERRNIAFKENVKAHGL